MQTFLHNTAHAYARAVSINCMVSSAVVRHLQTVPASIIYLKVSPQPAPWTDETLKMLFVWSIFVCSSLAFMGDELIGLDLIQEKIADNRKAYGGLKILQYALGLVFGVLTTNWGLNIILMQLSTNEKTAVVKYPLWIINMGFLLGSVLLVIFALWKIYDCRKYFKDNTAKKDGNR